MQKNSISLYNWCKENKRLNVLEEWDYGKNEITPKEISRASKVKAKWICLECGNKYLMAIQSRTLQNAGCPICSIKRRNEKERKRRIKENGSLAEKRPEMLAKWDYEKNKGISPSEISPKSSIKVWWKCQICGNEFYSRVIDVKSSTGCIKCRGNKYIDIGKDGKYIIYCHIWPNGKKYIGMTSSPLKIRFGNGNHYSNTSRFGMAIKEFGWENIKHEILEVELSLEEAYEKEKYYIKLYRTTEKEFGYNMAKGGKNGGIEGRVISKETREKIAKSNSGKKRTEKTREKLRATHLGQEPHNIRAVVKLDLQGNFLEEYDSIAEAVRKNKKVNSTNIWRCCTERRKTAGGYMWKYK